MISNILKTEIVKEVLEKSGFYKDMDAVLSMAECVRNDRFFFQVDNMKIVKFITWEEDNLDGKRYIFFNNLWIDPEYRGKDSIQSLRNKLRPIFKDVNRFIWFDRKKQKLVDRK